MKNHTLNNLYKFYLEEKGKVTRTTYPKDGKIRFDLAEGLWESSYLASLPDRSSTKLKEIICNYLKVGTTNISVFAGADEVIEIIPRLYINPKDKVMVLVPTFDRLLTTNVKAGATVITFALATENNFIFQKNEVNSLISKIEVESPKILWLCNPNNPTGKIIDIKYIKQIADKFPDLLIVVDEAFQEYYSLDPARSSTSLINQNNNIIIIRSFSKAFGLAGARIGYAVACKELISDLENYRTMYNISSEAQKLAIRVLSTSELSRIKTKINKVVEQRKSLVSKIKALDNYLVVEDSETNFLFVKHKSKDLFKELYTVGIVTSNWKSMPGVEDKNYVRISVNTPGLNVQLLAALKLIN